MRLFHRAHPETDGRIELLDVTFEPEPDPAVVLRRIAAEAVILQDEAEAVLAAVRRREHLGIVAPRGGPVVRRFFALRDELPRSCAQPGLERVRAVLDTILYHHAMQVATALDFLALEWRSEMMARQVQSIDGLGAPAELLEQIYRELVAIA